MKLKLTLLLFFLFPILVSAQIAGNEWINYGQSYYRFKIHSTGIYRISYEALTNSGLAIDQLNPKNFQVFGKESEIPLYIKGEEDGSFDEEDYIEFFAQANDGWLDADLFEDPEKQLNPLYSLINDTLNYYLTWNTSVSNQRIQPETSQNFGSYPTSPYCWATVSEVFNAGYSHGKRAGSILNPNYNDGEGYGVLKANGNYSFTLNTIERFVGSGTAPNAVFTTSFASTNDPLAGSPEGNHHLQVKVGTSEVFDEIFMGYQHFKLNQPLAVSQLSDQTVIQFSTVDDINLEANDSYAIGYAELKYPRTYQFQNISSGRFEPQMVSGYEKTKIVFNAFTGTPALVYTFGNTFTRSEIVYQDGQYKSLVPNNDLDSRTCFISSEEDIKGINELVPVTSSSKFTNYEALNYSNSFLIITHTSLIQEAQAYAAYRNARFNSMVVDVSELYDQFGGGIVKHPLAIRRFVKHLMDEWDQPPTHLFLIGKSLGANVIRKNSDAYSKCLVPTMGFPYADNLFTAGLENTLLEPAIPMGRLAARTSDQVMGYLNKVNEAETQPFDPWMKNIIHFGGGGNTTEQNKFKNYLNTYAQTARDTNMGAFITSYFKSSPDPIETNTTEEITNRINNGVSLMTFFGHASGTGFDVYIDDPENYQNNGKYPLILASSCYVGNIHSTSKSHSEEFVLIPEKGSIAYIASSTVGISAYLHAFNQSFYKQVFQKIYGESIGKQVISTISTIQGGGTDPLMVSNCLEMTLHGDPSIILNQAPKPDYFLDESSFAFDPQTLTAEKDSFDLRVILKNQGKAVSKPMDLLVERRFESIPTDSTYFFNLQTPLFNDTVNLRLPALHSISEGVNRFTFTLDPLNKIDELDNVINNRISDINYTIKSSQIIPIYPYDQSIIEQKTPTFTAFTGDVNAPLKTYIFEISTSEDFSTIVASESLIQNGGLIKWMVPLELSENNVYYWRVASSEDAQTDNWRTASFQYQAEKTGWGQKDPSQFNSNTFDLLTYLPESNQLAYMSGSKTLTSKLYGGRHIFENVVNLDLDQINYGGCPGPPQIFVYVFDPLSLEAWGNNYNGANPDHDFGNVLCSGRARVEHYFAFRQYVPEEMEALYDMLLYHIPEGYHVLVYSYTFSQFNLWSEYKPALFTLFQSMGSSLINVNAPNEVPFIFYTQKGNPQSTIETMGLNKLDTLELNFPLPISGLNGQVKVNQKIKTNHITGVKWSFNENEGDDRLTFKMIESATQQVIYSGQDLALEKDTTILLSGDSPLNVTLTLTDSLEASPAQFSNLSIYYKPFGDAVINPNLIDSILADTLQEGQLLQQEIGISNATPYSIDSLAVAFQILDQNDQMVFEEFRTLKLRDAYSDTTIEYERFTTGLRGQNRLKVRLNPMDQQFEQNGFNNEWSVPFYVKNDQTSPIMDVLFDGMHIIEGDLISSKPLISINIEDDNEYLQFDQDADTAQVNFFLTTPDGSIQRVAYADNGAGEVSWNFGSDKNQMSIKYSPNLTVDGRYKLRIDAKDKSGNSIEGSDYEISFEVINRAAITQVVNYPNPFSTRTHFVFTLTGNRIPDVFTIRIFTVSGRVVKEIFKNDLGPLRIGNNITDYTWDGTDNFGDQLANGVYFYRVDVGFFDENLDNIETGADQFFKSGIGKMYLLR